jgi:hypothetical protein
MERWREKEEERRGSVFSDLCWVKGAPCEFIVLLSFILV